MTYAIDLIENGDFCSLVGLTIVLCGVGKAVAQHPWAEGWGLRLAVGSFILYCTYGVVVYGRPSAEDLVLIALRGLIAGGLVLGVAWNLLGVYSWIRPALEKARRAAAARSRQRQLQHDDKRRQQKDEERRRREAEEWERTAPERNRCEREEQARLFEEQRTREKAKRRRQDVMVACESLFLLYAPEIHERFTREQFDDFTKKYMAETEPSELIEVRGQQLQTLIREHHNKVNPPEKFHSLQELATWYQEQKRQIEALPIDDSFKQDYLVQLNERYADLTQKVMENLAP